MVFSKKHFFEVKLIDEYSREYKELFPKEKDRYPYVVGEKGKCFMIKIAVNSSKCNDREVYGSKLFIDGEEVPGIKTFKKNGRYFGFKMGGGVYKQFLFGAPSYDISDKGGNKDIGKIKIIFYTTKEFSSGRRNFLPPHNYKKREQKYLDSNKKLCFKSLQVFEGKTFDNGHTTRQRLKERRTDRNIQYAIDYQNDIDDIEFNYSDFYGLIALGEISTNNIYDLRFIPTSKLDYKACGNAISLIIDKFKDFDNSISFAKLSEHFAGCCEHDLSLYYHSSEYLTLENLILKKFCDKFEIVNSNKIKLKTISNGKNISLNLSKDLELISSEYLLSGYQKKLLESRTVERSSKIAGVDSGYSNSMNVEPNDYVDLTSDEIASN